MNDPRVVLPRDADLERPAEPRGLRRWPQRVAAWTNDGRGRPSLFGEILDWMLAPLLVIWPVSVAIIYALAYSIANAPYDRALQGSVMALANQIGFQNGKVIVNLPAAASAILRFDETDAVFYQVRGPRNEVLAGDRDMPDPARDDFTAPRAVYFTSQVVRGAEIRTAYTFLEFRGATGPVLVQVGETLDKRTKLANEIINGVLLSQILLVPVFLFLVWYGLTQGIAPLNALQRKIRGRKPHDLSPINPDEAPEEVRPFIHAINDLMARLSQSLRAQQRFVADAAHQMRTPLAGLKTQAEIALRARDRAEVEHSMRQIAASADRASHLVNQLLALARAESDAPVAMARLDLGALAADVTREWVPQAIARSIDLGFEPCAEPALVEGNAMLLAEALANLIDNALRYTPRGGRVTVRVGCGPHATLEVEDNGIGIEEADRDRVFERFYRVLGTGAEGSGLGLAIVREIADLHRGRVVVEPTRGEAGSVFRVVLPRVGAETG
ncbi:MAG: sensor histidine kinase N-terminal domain-containing protein [Burkholderiales bacterium]|nr:sensor histidine kinase N-terminal domain-containing protein [Burkholderiales bacterium]